VVVEGGFVAFRPANPKTVADALTLFSRKAAPGGLRGSVAGLTEESLLLSVGVEHADDILADLSAALDSSRK
jgi:O-acetylhomoserine/O-acetylserine sulfhydrylase-like pyridoxal-dependent enzyme